MLRKMSIQLKLSFVTALLLSLCCISLTFILNYNTYKAVDMLQVPLLPQTMSNEENIVQTPIADEIIESAIPTTNAMEAKSWYSAQSIMYMILIVLGGSVFTYVIVGRVLQPLLRLNDRVKNITVHNLSNVLETPSSKDEIYELTTSFNKMIHKLNGAFMVQKQFSASAAHELRTPLTIIQTRIDVFNKQSTHKDEEYNQLIHVVNHQSMRLRKLVEILLQMTNLDDIKEITTIQLADMMEDIVHELSIVARDKNINIKLHTDDSVIMGNIDLLYRAFYNVIENAIKYNVENGYVEIYVQKKKDDKLVEVLITDTGIGISDNEKEHIFEPFFRVDTSRSRSMGGVGLGLSFVENVITKQGGSIEVYDNKSSGTCFRLCLKC